MVCQLRSFIFHTQFCRLLARGGLTCISCHIRVLGLVWVHAAAHASDDGENGIFLNRKNLYF